ncbi:MAG: hypothetical protein M1832_002629 [Thelocarpon impressellum]|nr:MAG: hypothetical protein M1832_002629 [Thelocarpon impressellum]
MSSQVSFHTVDEMEWSQPPEAATEKRLPSTAAGSGYRPARELPYELREHCVIYFEEGLYAQALNLLTTLVASGTSATTVAGALPRAFVPPPQHVGLAATLVVHPSLTTRASRDRLQASNAALRFLRTTNALVGPGNARFGAAFTFASTRRGGGRRRGGGTHEDSTEGGGRDVDAISIEMANAGSVWNLADDFWHASGWAFNCAVAYPHRWARWELWMSFMLDVLEADWKERAELDRAEDPDADGDVFETRVRGSIITGYLPSELGRYGGVRRVLRAIFADGSAKSLGEFKEVFPNETREKKGDGGGVKRKREARLDVDENMYGDYVDSEDEEDDGDGPASSPPQQSQTDSDGHESDDDVLDGAAPLGGMGALLLRQRLLSLLSAVADRLPETFTPLPTLYSSYAEHLRALPLATFSLFLSPSTLPHFVLPARLSLTQVLLRSLLPSTAPVPVHSASDPGSDSLTQATLEERFLPYASSSNAPASNAQTSILVEALLRAFQTHRGLEATDELREAVESGIAAREEKAKGGGGGRGRKKKDKAQEERGKGLGEEGVYLAASGARLRALVDSVFEEAT